MRWVVLEAMHRDHGPSLCSFLAGDYPIDPHIESTLKTLLPCYDRGAKGCLVYLCPFIYYIRGFLKISIILMRKLKRKCIVMQSIPISFHLHRNYFSELFLAVRSQFRLILSFFANHHEWSINPSLENLLEKHPLSDKDLHKSVPMTFKNWSQLVIIRASQHCLMFILL